jgi:hypothetical protein
MVLELSPAPVTPRARLGPRLTAAAARSAGTHDGHIERTDSAEAGLLWRQLNRRVERSHPLVSDEPAPDPIHDMRHRREIDRDFIGEARSLEPTLPTGEDGQGTEMVRGVTAHEKWFCTLGPAPG